MNKLAFILLTLLLQRTLLPAQDAVTNNIIQQFNAYRTNNLQEKLYVHTDKNFYTAGETCWFKIYATDASFNKPLGLSKIAYVEIITADHKPLLQAKINMDNASGSGSFQLPFSVPSGNYLLRAYTNWMKNFSAAYYFEKQITIINTLRQPAWNANDTTTNYNIQFFPEGGHLVTNIESVVAFKIMDNTGKGVDGRGYILNQRNDTVITFQTLRYGMGRFNLAPVKNDSYKVTVITPDKQTIVASLPEVDNEGYVMHATNQPGDKIKISVTTNVSNEPVLHLLAYTRQSLKAALSAPVSNQVAEFTIDSKDLGEGISQFTIFNNDRKAVCERLYFKRPQQRLSTTIATDSSVFNKRNKVNITLSTSIADQPVAADLSVAVVLLDSLQQLSTENIFTYLWLSSDIKGKIEHAVSYFTDSSSTGNEAADNLVLTQGWRRFSWKDVTSNTSVVKKFLPEIDGHIITGTVTHKTTGLPAANINAYLSVAGKPFRFNYATSNTTGHIQFDVTNFYGTNEIVLQTNTGADGNYRVDIATPFSDQFSTTSFNRFLLNENDRTELTNRSVATQVQQVYATSNAQRFYNEGLNDTAAFYGKGFKTYLLDDYTRFITMEEVMREFIKEIRLRKNRDQYYMEIRKTNEVDFTGKPLVLLDGIPVFDVNKIIALDPLKVKKIDVVASGYFYGPLITDGIVSYSSYNGDLAGMPLDPSTLIVDYAGLQLQREFYIPVYDTPEKIESRLPDFRNVLYWNPYAGTETNGKRVLNFYTGDLTGKYAVIVEGITATGAAAMTALPLTVK